MLLVRRGGGAVAVAAISAAVRRQFRGDFSGGIQANFAGGNRANISGGNRANIGSGNRYLNQANSFTANVRVSVAMGTAWAVAIMEATGGVALQRVAVLLAFNLIDISADPHCDALICMRRGRSFADGQQPVQLQLIYLSALAPQLCDF